MTTVISTLAAAAAPAPYPSASQDGPEGAFLALADASPAMIWIADGEGRCLFANQSWLDFRGRTFHQELGTGWLEAIHPQDRDRWIREYRAAFAAGRRHRARFQALNASGDYQSMESVGQPWPRPGEDGGAFIGSLAVVEQAQLRTRDAMEQLASLTARERQVLAAIAQGHATKEVAAKLGVSYKTADSHRTHILKKLGFHESASLVRFAVRAGLIEP
ncbi:MAG TPA: LuxR C-terminal-related transcriptional regulator [Bryobacteraceae bacterium]|nr:LuxR C-terminal-related transcriptional regulator [Bryobacteraceae bacterium]